MFLCIYVQHCFLVVNMCMYAQVHWKQSWAAILVETGTRQQLCWPKLGSNNPTEVNRLQWSTSFYSRARFFPDQCCVNHPDPPYLPQEQKHVCPQYRTNERGLRLGSLFERAIKVGSSWARSSSRVSPSKAESKWARVSRESEFFSNPNRILVPYRIALIIRSLLFSLFILHT